MIIKIVSGILFLLTMIGCVSESVDTVQELPTSYSISAMANGFADIQWDLNSDFTMQLYMEILESDEELYFAGTWKYEGETVVVTFVAEVLKLSALFDWNDKNENNIVIVSERTVSFDYDIRETWIYGVLCEVER